jgi:sensor histidine kinase YesM
VLAAIEYFVLNNSTEEAARYLKLYSDFTNQTLQDIDRPARTVDEEVDYVTKYLELQKLRYDERLTYNVMVADNVDRKALLPTMLLHTYVENAIKHGISPKPEGGHVDVVITSYENDTVVTVEDNGIGRRKAAQLNRNSTKMGLRILSEQIQLYNKSNKHRIRQHVRNLKDADGKTAGTHFDMTVPKDYVYE